MEIMYRIAICDDQMTEIDKTRKCLTKWQERHPGCELNMEHFTSAERMLKCVKENGYNPDLLLLDVCMPEKSGVMVAQEYRAMGNEGTIVFITASREHALEAFGVNAVQYLIKPVDEQALFQVMDNLFSMESEKRKNYLLLRINGHIHRVTVDDILYCEAQGKNQCLHLADGTSQKLNMTLVEICEMLSGQKEFSRVGASYIVNLNHVDSLNAREIYMDNGESIFLPRGAYQPLRDNYFKYYCEE